MSVLSIGILYRERGKDFIQTFLGNIDRRSRNDGSREVALNLEHIVGVPYIGGAQYKAASSGRKEK